MFRVVLHGIPIECETAEEMAALLAAYQDEWKRLHPIQSRPSPQEKEEAAAQALEDRKLK